MIVFNQTLSQTIILKSWTLEDFTHCVYKLTEQQVGAWDGKIILIKQSLRSKRVGWKKGHKKIKGESYAEIQYILSESYAKKEIKPQ